MEKIFLKIPIEILGFFILGTGGYVLIKQEWASQQSCCNRVGICGFITL